MNNLLYLPMKFVKLWLIGFPNYWVETQTKEFHAGVAVLQENEKL